MSNSGELGWRAACPTSQDGHSGRSSVITIFWEDFKDSRELQRFLKWLPFLNEAGMKAEKFGSVPELVVVRSLSIQD